MNKEGKRGIPNYKEAPNSEIQSAHERVLPFYTGKEKNKTSEQKYEDFFAAFLAGVENQLVEAPLYFRSVIEGSEGVEQAKPKMAEEQKKKLEQKQKDIVRGLAIQLIELEKAMKLNVMRAAELRHRIIVEFNKRLERSGKEIVAQFKAERFAGLDLAEYLENQGK